MKGRGVDRRGVVEVCDGAHSLLSECAPIRSNVSAKAAHSKQTANFCVRLDSIVKVRIGVARQLTQAERFRQPALDASDTGSA